MFRVEKALPCDGHQKPDYQGLRAKGEVIKMMSERLRKRKKAPPFEWPLRKLWLS
jgi:hypothetical protein